MYFKEDKSYLDKSSLIMKRYIVGGAQNVVILYFPNLDNNFVWSNLAKSYTNTQAPQIHCPYNLPQTALPQPVSATVKCIPFGSTLCQL